MAQNQQEVGIARAERKAGKKSGETPEPGPAGSAANPESPAGQTGKTGSGATPAAGGGTGGYAVARPMGSCLATGRAFAVGEKFHAGLRETPTGLERVDVCAEAWGGFDKSGLLASWVATMPPPNQEKKKLFVDDETLLTLFERLSDTNEPTKLRFRFVLGLVLMRKRLVSYEGEVDRQGQSYWRVKLRGRAEPMDLLNPHLTEDQVGDVAGQLGEILSSEL